MKISEMLQREDFYSILPDTINRYADFLGIEPGSAVVVGKGEKANLYVNEKLNAIISGKPSKDVKDYLKTEYTVGGGLARKMAVAAYLAMASNIVRHNADKGLKLNTDLNLNNILIYPCNKKIRLFDFSSGIVYTVLKDGFPDLYIKRETEFRLNKKTDFVPTILSNDDGCYSESIIKNGRPLARIQDAAFVENMKRESLQLLAGLTEKPMPVQARKYLTELKDRCVKMLAGKEGFKNATSVMAVFDKLLELTDDSTVELVTSHGDFQPGNIWIDSEGKVVIIDWETIKERSPFYDYAALYCRLRNHGGLQNLCTRIKENEHLSAIDGCPVSSVLRIILAEELEYQTEELLSFPNTMGIDIYNKFITELKTINI